MAPNSSDSSLLLVDVHAHLDHALFAKDLDQVLADAKAKGVRAIIANGVNPASNQSVLDLAKKYPIIKPALGLYPLDALNLPPDGDGMPHTSTPVIIEQALAFIQQHKDDIVAIGEVGLEFKMDLVHQAEQKKLFQDIIALSERINKPLIIHSRGAELEVLDMLESSKVNKALLHCYSGSKKLIKRASDLGFSFSIPANLQRSQHFQMLVSMVPTSQLLTETDAPLLAPTLGDRNVPQNVAQTIEQIAKIKGLDSTETSMMVFKNYQALFSKS